MTKVEGTTAGAKARRRGTQSLRNRKKMSTVGAQMGCGRAQAKEGRHNPIYKDCGLDPEGGGGNRSLALCRGATPDLHFKKVTWAYFFYDKNENILGFSFKAILGVMDGNRWEVRGYCRDGDIWPQLEADPGHAHCP